MITLYDEADALASTIVFGGLGRQRLRQLAFASDRIDFIAGEMIFRQGETGLNGYRLLSGQAEIRLERDGATRTLGTIGPEVGAVIGDHAMILGGAYRISARAVTPVETLRIPRDALLVLLDGDKTAMGQMLEALAAMKAQAERMFSISFD